MRVFVPRARGDIYREGNYVYVKRLGNNFCLLALLERYILMRDIILSSSVALFRPVRLFICSLNCLSNQPSSFSGYVSVVLKGKNNLRSFKRSDFEHNNISRPSSEQPRAYTDILSDALSGRPHQSLKPSFTALSSREISLFLWIPLSSIHKTLPWAVYFLAAMWKDDRVFLWASIRPDFKEYFTFRFCIRD